MEAVEHHVFVDEMKKAKLSCKVTSQTSTLISWTFNNKPIYVGSRVEIVNTSINNSVYNSLFIDNVNVSDSGTYTCYGHFAGVLVVETITLSVRGKYYILYSYPRPLVNSCLCLVIMVDGRACSCFEQFSHHDLVFLL